MKSKALNPVPVTATALSEKLEVGNSAGAERNSGGIQKPLRTPQFQAFLDSLEPQPWKRKKMTVNWATSHFNPVTK